jgi:DNA-binding MarR family transcriptional regulator
LERDKHTVRMPTPSPNDSLGFMFWQTSNLYQKKLVNALKPVDLTLAQFVILAGTARLENGGPEEPVTQVTQVRLARQAGTDVMMTSQVIRKLVGRGLLSRRQSGADSRANHVELTERGREIVRRALAIAQEFEKSFFEPLADRYDYFLRDLRSVIRANDESRGQTKK